METVLAPPAGPSFEEALAELQLVLRKLEDGETGLEDALACYEQGIGLLKRCYTQLREAEQRILLLTGVADDGQPVTQPFLHAPTGDGPPRRKRSGKTDAPF